MWEQRGSSPSAGEASHFCSSEPSENTHTHTLTQCLFSPNYPSWGMPVTEESLRLSTDRPVCRQSRPPALTCMQQIHPAPKPKDHSTPCPASQPGSALERNVPFFIKLVSVHCSVIFSLCIMVESVGTLQVSIFLLMHWNRISLINSFWPMLESKNDFQWSHSHSWWYCPQPLFFPQSCFSTRPQARVKECYSLSGCSACAASCRGVSCELTAWVLHPPQLFLPM